MTEFIRLMQVYEGSNGDATKELYARLMKLGGVGEIAVNVFRAHKTSARAKVYRGGGYKGAAYDRKQWSLDNLAKLLDQEAKGLNVIWGWKEDPAKDFHKWVIYVELPTGQVSYHTADRGVGPDFPGKWDGSRDQGPSRICRWIDQLLTVTASSEVVA